MKRKTLVAMAAALVSGMAMAAALNVGPATKSTLSATFRQEGVSVERPFKAFTGTVNYDPANAAAATAQIEVDMASLDLGDPAYSAELRKKGWFDSATYPRAVFRSTGIKPVSATKFDATGTLTIKGRTQTITVPVTVGSSAAGQVFDGSFVMSRKTFGIGDAIWDEVVDDKVTVKFHLVGGK